MNWSRSPSLAKALTPLSTHSLFSFVPYCGATGGKALLMRRYRVAGLDSSLPMIVDECVLRYQERSGISRGFL